MDEAERIRELSNKLKGNTTRESPPWLRTYHLGVGDWEDGLLSPRGLDELFLIGFRWRERLGWLLVLDAHGYDPVSFSVRHSFRSRTGKTCSDPRCLFLPRGLSALGLLRAG